MIGFPLQLPLMAGCERGAAMIDLNGNTPDGAAVTNHGTHLLLIEGMPFEARAVSAWLAKRALSRAEGEAE